MNIPDIVLMLCDTCNAWVVGGAAAPNAKAIKDWDVIVPPRFWEEAKMVIPLDSKLNSFRGHKFTTEEGVNIDLWMSYPDKYLLNTYEKFLWNPAKAIRISIDRAAHH